MTFSLNREAIEAAPPPPPRPQVFGLLVGIVVHPRRTLSLVAEGPRWLWAIPLALAVLFLAARLLVWAPLQAQAMAAEQQRLQEVSMEAMSKEMPSGLPTEAVQVAPQPTSAVIALPLAGGLAGILLGWLLRAAILHLASMVLGGRQSFGVLYRVAAWAGAPLILRDGVQALFMALTGAVIEGPGLSGLALSATAAESAVNLGGGGPTLLGATAAASPTLASVVLGRIDLYTLWFLALLVLGVLVTGKLSRGKALVVVGFYALLALLPALAPLLFYGFGG